MLLERLGGAWRKCALRTSTTHRRRGFSLLELIIVLAVLGVAAAIISPRLSRAAAPLPSQPADLLTGRLRAIRLAVDTYAHEHGGRLPAGDGDTVRRQLTQFTDV